MSEARRCCSVCIGIGLWEKRRGCVSCLLVMEVVRDDMLSLTFKIQEEMKTVAKEVEPTGWPRSEAGGEFDWEGWGGFVGGMWAGGEFGNCCRD